MTRTRPRVRTRRAGKDGVKIVSDASRRKELRLSKPVAALCALVVLAGTLGGCTSARNGLGTHDSACFRVLPEALAAVHRHGHLVGERYLPPRALILNLPNAVAPDALQDASKVATCLVAFTGHFKASAVERGWAPSGELAASPSSSCVSATSCCWRRSCSCGSRASSSSPTSFLGSFEVMAQVCSLSGACSSANSTLT